MKSKRRRLTTWTRGHPSTREEYGRRAAVIVKDLETGDIKRIIPEKKMKLPKRKIKKTRRRIQLHSIY